MNPIMAIWAVLISAATSVTGLGVVPVEDRTEVVVEVDGPVTVRDFQLQDPDRIVLDLRGATSALGQDSFDAIRRGGVHSLRVGQFTPEVLRVVVHLDRPVEYSVETSDGEVRVSFPNPAGPFRPWRSRAQAVAAASRGPAPASRTGSRPPQEARRITVYFSETPIRDVLATFSEFSGKSIVAGANVTGEITADIRSQPWDVALAAILEAHGLAARELESGIIRVDNVEQLRKLERVEDLVTRTVKVKYANVDSIMPAVEGLVCSLGRSGAGADTLSRSGQLALAFQSAGGDAGTECRGGVTRNRSTNSLIITAGRSAIDEIISTVRQLDVRTPQVTISAKIIFVDRTALEGLGVTYDLKDSQGNQINQLVTGGVDLNGDGIISEDESSDENVVLLGGSSIAALANAADRIPSPTLQLLTSLVFNRHSLIAFVDALESKQITDIQAAPVITTMDHRAARVQVGEETPVRVVDAGAGTGGGGQGGGGFPRATVQFKETGVILEVTPHVTGDQVLLELHAERSDIGLAPSDIGVTFNTQESDTQILVNDGETAVISGLTLIEKTEVRSGIPILMDIPVIGALFRTTRQEEKKQDLLIMVTPHIVREGGA